MNRRQAITKACLLLRRQEKEESLARFLLMYMFDESPSVFSESLSLELTKDEEEKYFSLIKKSIHEDAPLSHLVGFEYFYDRRFKVTKDVLSPRMETEELVYKVIDYIQKERSYEKGSLESNRTHQNTADIMSLDEKSQGDDIVTTCEDFEDLPLRILDLCTGSGIIAITLKKEVENIEVVASDISKAALSVAKENAKNLFAEVEFIQSDLFKNIDGQFDIIVSNPPYIAYGDKKTIENNVLNYDPHLALFADEEGMYFYRKIIEKAHNFLKKDGVLFFEIGYDQKDKIEKLGQASNFSVKVFKDINGRDRMAFLFSNI